MVGNFEFLFTYSLQQRKKQWKKEEEERVANAPDPECPEGHRVLPDAERRETLQLLKDSKSAMSRNSKINLSTYFHLVPRHTSKEDIKKLSFNVPKIHKKCFKNRIDQYFYWLCFVGRNLRNGLRKGRLFP